MAENQDSIEVSWLRDIHIKVSAMHTDVGEMKAIIPRLAPIGELPAKVDRLAVSFEKVGDAILTSALGKEHVPAAIFKLVTKTLCAIIFVLIVAFCGAQGWITPLLHKIGF